MSTSGNAAILWSHTRMPLAHSDQGGPILVGESSAMRTMKCTPVGLWWGVWCHEYRGGLTSRISDPARLMPRMEQKRDRGGRCSALGVRFIAWKRGGRAFADPVPLVVELECLVLLRLEPEN